MALQRLVAEDGRNGAEILRALGEQEPPIKLSAGVWSRLLSGAQPSTRRSVRQAIEEELLGWPATRSVLLGEMSLEEALRGSKLFRVERALERKLGTGVLSNALGYVAESLAEPAVAAKFLFGGTVQFPDEQRAAFRESFLEALCIVLDGLPAEVLSTVTAPRLAALFELFGLPPKVSQAVAGTAGKDWPVAVGEDEDQLPVFATWGPAGSPNTIEGWHSFKWREGGLFGAVDPSPKIDDGAIAATPKRAKAGKGKEG